MALRKSKIHSKVITDSAYIESGSSGCIELVILRNVIKITYYVDFFRMTLISFRKFEKSRKNISH